MNVFEKLQSCRVKLQESDLSKSGENKFAGYKYFELQDFMPKINELFNENKLFSQVSFTSDLATLKVYNTEKSDEVIEFTSPMAEANLKGCHEIQNLGAVETYQRRYLYMMALEIVEHDALDKTHEKSTETNNVAKEVPMNKSNGQSKSITNKQVGLVKSLVKKIASAKQKQDNEVYEALKVDDVTKLTSWQASKAIKTLNKWVDQLEEQPPPSNGPVDPNDKSLPF